MRTACFVDGYNLFYGLLAGTPYKWLNLPTLLSHIVQVQDPSSNVVSISYFTSGVKPDLATRGIASKEAQDTYIRALKAKGVDVFFGRHRLEPGRAPRFITKDTPASRTDQVDVWLLEEKETDGSLHEFSHWMRRHVSIKELETHQFPDRVPTRKAPAQKPDYW